MGLLADTADQPADPPGHAHGTAPADFPAQCLELGVVRAVDTERSLLYLLTPLPIEQLRRVNLLQVGPMIMRTAMDCMGHADVPVLRQVGRLELPPALLQTTGLQSPYLAAFSMSAEASGSKEMKSRGNMARARQAG